MELPYYKRKNHKREFALVVANIPQAQMLLRLWYFTYHKSKCISFALMAPPHKRKCMAFALMVCSILIAQIKVTISANQRFCLPYRP